MRLVLGWIFGYTLLAAIAFGKTSPPVETRLRGLVLLSDRQQMLKKEELASVQGVEARGVEIPGLWSRFEASMTPLYLDQPLSEETIRTIKEGIQRYYEQSGYPLVIVSIPPQNISSGVLQVEVEESRLGKVSVSGQKKSSSEKVLLNYMSAVLDKPINERALLKDVDFMNRNPFRKVELIYSPGDQKNQTDITLRVQEEQLCHLYVGVDNTGVPTTGRNRYFAGITFDRMFGLDQVLFYQYTTAQDFRHLQAHSVQYLAFLSNQTILNLYGGYSSVHVHLPNPGHKNSGQSAQASVRYTVPLKISALSFVHELTGGFDFKQTNNTVEYVDLNPAFANTVNLSQFMLGYRFRYTNSYSATDCTLDLYSSPGKWLPDQQNSRFSALRPGAKNQWLYLKGSWKVDFRFPSFWNLVFLTRYEWSSNALLPSEQLGIGGYESVRGYDERQLDADTGGFTSLELHTPSFPLFLRQKNRTRDTVHFLLFAEGGVSYDKIRVPETKRLDYLLGAGPGVRYSISNYLNARCDLGFKLHNRKAFTGGSPMIHFSVIGNY